MKPKLIEAVKKMIADAASIKDLLMMDEEIYFKYGKYAFSVTHRAKFTPDVGPHSLYIYPKYNGPLLDLANAFDPFSGNDQPDLVVYHDTALPPEEKDLFRDLFQVVKHRYLGVDELIDDILDT